MRDFPDAVPNTQLPEKQHSMYIIGMGNIKNINIEMQTGYYNIELQKANTAVAHETDVCAISKVLVIQSI